MVFSNEMQRLTCRKKAIWEKAIVCLAPYAPHIAEELWEASGHNESISLEPFPSYDSKLVEERVVTIAVQVNGKLRGTFSAPAKSSKELLLEEARKVESVIKFLEGQTIIREIVVIDKLVNFAVKNS
jgi:leucyl-tRNA synthetase